MNPRSREQLGRVMPLWVVLSLSACMLIPFILLHGTTLKTSVSLVIYWVVVDVHETLSEVRGALQDCADNPLENVRVELYDHGEVALMDFAETQRAPKQKSVAVTKTRKKGAFKFGKISPGRYEVRVDDPEWRQFLPTSLVINVARSKSKLSKRSLRTRLSFEGMSCETLPDEPKKQPELDPEPLTNQSIGVYLRSSEFSFWLY